MNGHEFKIKLAKDEVTDSRLHKTDGQLAPIVGNSEEDVPCSWCAGSKED